jgi:hypothetical protein
MEIRLFKKTQVNECVKKYVEIRIKKQQYAKM